jgi:hypothetical protein
MTEPTYWRCSRCEVILPRYGGASMPSCSRCWEDEGLRFPLSPVEVHPVGTGDELARLRELEIKVGIEKAHRWRTNEYG